MQQYTSGGISGSQALANARDRDPDAPWPDASGLRDFKPLGRLHRDYGPHGNSWSNSAAICACMADERASDIREWLHYYKYAVASEDFFKIK